MILDVLNDIKYRRIKAYYDKALRDVPRVSLSARECMEIRHVFRRLEIPQNPQWGGGIINIIYLVLTRIV